MLCFDEFFVSDIADAMILGNLMEKLFARGVSLVATSNIVPDRLYENGLQRERFLPAIAVLKANVDVLNVDGGTDYRLRTLEQAELYHWPLDAEADAILSHSFAALSPVPGQENVALEIEGPYGSLWLDDPNAPDAGHWPLAYLNSYGFTIAAGSNEIQRNILGERVLGLAKSK